LHFLSLSAQKTCRSPTLIEWPAAIDRISVIDLWGGIPPVRWDEASESRRDRDWSNSTSGERQRGGEFIKRGTTRMERRFLVEHRSCALADHHGHHVDIIAVKKDCSVNHQIIEVHALLQTWEMYLYFCLSEVFLLESTL